MANGYRLPTEAEWEYACRAGSTGDFAESDVHEISWNNSNAGNNTHDVGTKLPNKFGVYDMHGNVSEWVWDLFDAEYYLTFTTLAIDPTGPVTADPPERGYRGGSYLDGTDIMKSFHREALDQGSSNFNLGFRIARNK
jgi:formylglycine-generating enzyme required for sulfatase activity